MSNSHIPATLHPFLWFAPKEQAQEEHRCYVCNALDGDSCHGIGGEAAECPRVRCRIAAAQALDAQALEARS